MRYIVFTIILAVSGCKQGNHREWLPNETPTLVQVFKINANRDTTLVGTNGTILKVQAKSFQTIRGEEAQGEIELRIQEFYAKHEFVRNRLSTITVDGQLLQSSGMLFIQAKRDTSNLSLKDDHPLTIMFPRMVSSGIANLFSGEKGPNDEIRWNLLESIHNDTLVIRKETITRKRLGGELVSVKLQFVIGKDTTDLSTENERAFANVLNRQPRNNGEFDSVRTSVPGYEYTDRPTESSYYVFKTSTLGFINCDIFVNIELNEFTVNLDNSESDVFIIIDSLNSVLYPNIIAEETNDYVFSVPRDMEISIVAYRNSGKKSYLGIERAKANVPRVSMQQSEKSLDGINVEIERLSQNAR